ncbi:MAG TPA: hypothetical protein ENI99_03255 [Sedimenticola sp.]|nr:hypothetical protein [Sedimenticola sp.]
MSAIQAQDHSKTTLGFAGCVTHVLLLVLIIFLAAWAFRWGWAEVLVAQPRSIMNSWSEGKPIPSEEEMDRLGRLLAKAQSLNKQNADIAFDRGRFAEWQAMQYPLWTELAHKHREEAIQHFREAIDIRPSWGMAWVHLANSLILNQQLYSGGIDALEKASVLAPLEGAVQQRVIWLGLSQWRHVDIEQRYLLRGIIENALWYQRRLVKKAIVDFKLEEELADMLALDRNRETLKQNLDKRKRLNKTW